MGSAGIGNATYTSGLSCTGSFRQYVNVTFATPSGGTAATGKLYLTTGNTIASGDPIFTDPTVGGPGTGYTTPPTTATITNGTASCTGTPVLTSNLMPTPVAVTATYVNATTVTLSANASLSISGGAIASVYTDNFTAVQKWITDCESQGVGPTSSCYAPSAGQYGISQAVQVVSPSLTIQGGGVITIGTISPFITGTVFVQETPATDVLDIVTPVALNPTSQSPNLKDFGIRFGAALAFVKTGHGISVNAGNSAANGAPGVIENIDGWGTDGTHDVFNMVSGGYVVYPKYLGGGRGLL